MAIEDNMNRISEIIKNLEPKEAEYLSSYLRNAPYYVLESLQIVKKDKNVVFIEENTPSDTIYILAKGVVRAVDYRIRGVAYDYMWFHAVKVFGSMEVFFNLPTYKTTLMTVTPCTMLVLTKKNFERWIWDDKNALKMDIEQTGGYLLEQNLSGRIFLFLQGMDRIVYMFVNAYEQEGLTNLVIEESRQELAERSGFSVKTVNRSIKKMEEDGYIGRKGRKILVTNEHYKKMKKYLEPIIVQSL